MPIPLTNPTLQLRPIASGFARRAAGVLLGLLLASTALAQATLTGVVTNSATGATLEGARVFIAERNVEAVTDSLGSFRFENVAPGRLSLTVSYTGLTTATITADVGAAGTTHRNVGLTAAIYQLEKFVVGSEREGNAKAITLQRLSDGVKSIVSADAFGGLAGNPADLAMRLPGVEGESVGGDMRYLRIRGLHQNLSSISQDGNRLADAGSAGATREFQFQTVGSDSIERIEVTKSPTPDQDGDSIGGVVNLVSKTAFDSSPERRLRGSIGAIWRATDPRDPSRPNASFSYSEVFGGRLGVNLNLAYRPHGSIIDMSTQGHQQLAAGVEGPAYQYLLTALDFRNVRTRFGGGLRLDFKWDDRVRFFTNLQLHKHIEHSDHAQATWQTNQAVATLDAAGNPTGTNGILPGYTDYETRVRAVVASTLALTSQAFYKLGKTLSLNAGGFHRYPTLAIDYDVYSSQSKADYPGNNSLTYTVRNLGFTIRKDARLFPSITQTAGSDWTQLGSFTDNAYNSARMVGWDGYLGATLNVKKTFIAPRPFYVKAGLRFREQTRDLDNTPYNTVYLGPDGVMGPNAALGGRNDDNLAQFGLMNRSFPGTELRRYGRLPFPAFQAVGRIDDLDADIAANPTHWRRSLATDLQAAYTNNQQFTEQIRAGYLMGQTLFGRLSLLSGVRIEDTFTKGTGSLQVLTPEERARRAAWGTAPLTDAEITRRAKEEFGRRTTRTGSYRSVFPGLHAKYQFARNLLARFSYSENIGRPGVGQLIPRTTVNYDNQTLSTSNPSLEPQWARNYDLSAEFYFEPAGTLSVGAFRKDISKFIYTAGGTLVGSGPDNGFNGDYAGFAMTTQYNGGSARVKGIEFGYMQQFTFLPAPWNGFGAFANATRLQAEGNYGSGTAIALAPNPRIAGFNPFIANAGLSYIRGRLNLRVSYNYRDRYLGTFNANESRAVYFAARPTVDVKTLFNLNRHLSLYLDVVNVFTQPDRETQFGYGRPQTTHLMRPQFLFGANLRN
ncbi:MAG: TonB-dependent receptor [Verrucomicrobia bacterium]|nr:TonB-dependent receptor [Verrucomicrobiota bacterium]